VTYYLSVNCYQYSWWKQTNSLYSRTKY